METGDRIPFYWEPRRRQYSQGLRSRNCPPVCRYFAQSPSSNVRYGRIKLSDVTRSRVFQPSELQDYVLYNTSVIQ